MYDIRQFKPTLYMLLLLGLSGFCLAARSPGLWLVCMVAIGGHYTLRQSGIMPPLPNWAAALVALGFGFVTFQRFVNDPGNQLLAAGQFLVLLQLVKLYQEGTGDARTENRNYVSLLVLSLLLMVAASISTASLVFGVIFIAYLFTSLYCCLLFHLKVETEAAKSAMTLPKDVISPAVLRQDERFLPSSMRRLTVLVAAAGLTCAVVVFVFFPRGPGAGLFGQLNFRPAQALTGFSEQVSFEQVARISQSQELVAHVELTEDGEVVQGTRALYLRGVTLDTYTGDGKGAASAGGVGVSGGDRGRGAWQWTRSVREEPQMKMAGFGSREDFARPGPKAIVANVKLQPTGVNVIFAPAGPYALLPGRELKFVFFNSDETLRAGDSVNGRLDYTVFARGEIGYRPRPMGDPRGPVRAALGAPSRIDPRIVEYARRPEVSGVDADGTPLWRQRGEAFRPHPLDARIAENIERHLQSQFAYTLDLTDTTRKPDEDPIVKFLYETKRGHCEYFAGAMVLLCQSLGLDARMVTGFRCDEFNNLIGRYVVKQSHAHAWTEVRLINEGGGGGLRGMIWENWKQFDPTSGREFRPAEATGVFARVKRFYDYLEFSWADSVVAYDRDRRDNLMSGVERALTNTAIRTQRGVTSWDSVLPDPSSWWISPRLIGGVMIVIVMGGVAAVGYFAWERWKLKRRANRIGLGDLPDDDKIRLARQLGFYDDLLRMLEQRGYRRAAHLTPLEFSQTLAHLPSETYDAVRRLTRIYYRIRYGRLELAPEYQKRVKESLVRLEPTLGGARK